MSLNTIMGWRRNLFGETAEHARLIQAESPFLFEHELEALRAHGTPETKLATVNALWPAQATARTAWNAPWTACAGRSKRRWTTAAG